MFHLGLRGRIHALRDKLASAVGNGYFGRPNLFDLSTSERVGSAYHKPSDMCSTDGIMLYALVRGLRPKYALEIGARWGGSAKIITNAMQDNGVGHLAGIDPETENFGVRAADLHGRYTLIKGYSPQAIPEALSVLGTDELDFVFIDALHTHDAVSADFRGCLPYLASGAHVLFHDAYHQGVDKAINDIIGRDSRFVDLGILTRNPSISSPVAYDGMRLVRAGGVDGKKLISEAYERIHGSPPVFHDALRNYDEFANKIGLGATPEELEIIKHLTSR